MMKKGKIAFGHIGFKVSEGSITEEKEDSTKKTNNELTTEKSTQPGFGVFSSQPFENLDQTQVEEETEGVSSVLGFSSFGKKAKLFNIDELAEKSRKLGAERNREQLEKLSLQQQAEQNVIGPPGPDIRQNTNSHTEKEVNVSDEDNSENEDIGPPIPQEIKEMLYDSDEEEEKDGYGLPITTELSLHHGSKLISALAVDPAGSRMVTGSTDYDVKYWDFQGMDLMREPFRSFRPSDGYPINSVEYSCTGDKVLVVSGAVHGKVYNRDGIEVYECVKGDMYLHDMTKTKGHISGLTDGKWHPKDKEEFLTSARDGTCRIWHVNKPLSQLHVIKPRAMSGLKTLPTTCNFSKDGLVVACACDDGSVQMWDHRKSYVNTIAIIRKAHEKNTDTSSLVFSYDNKNIATRGGDDTLKLWDIRNTRQPVNVATDLFNRIGTTDCLFSPNDQLVITGTSLNKGDQSSYIKMFDRNSFEIVKEIDMGTMHTIKMVWHPRLNQLMVGCGDGQIRIFYDRQLSHNGAILVAGKHKKRAKQAEVVLSKQIITPHALPMFREERHKSTRKQEEKDRKDPLRSQQPELPLGKSGSGGRVATGGSTLSSYIIRNMGILNKLKEEEDPREALMRHAEEAQKNPYWVTPAYAKTQPITIFEQPDNEEQPTKKQKT